MSAPFWNFYSADALSLFFKRIALATTAGVLVMMLDFAPSVLVGVPAATPQSGLGEFFTLPLFTCAGLMWMASAIDFVLIFVSLELVTISFYVLVGFTRRNPASLEAAVKYLVLSAVATGFLVYGITWIFGATGETNLQKITTVFSRPGLEQNAALFGGVLVIVALGFKIAAVPFHIWVADVYQGAPTPVTAYLSVGSKAAGFIVLLRVLEPFLILPRMRTVLVAIAVLTSHLRQPRGAAANECQTAPRLLKYCPRRLSTRGRSLVFRTRRCFLSRRLSLDDVAQFRCAGSR